MGYIYWQIYGVMEGHRLIAMYEEKRTKWFWFEFGIDGTHGFWRCQEVLNDVYFWDD
jgi:hypothetical protein